MFRAIFFQKYPELVGGLSEISDGAMELGRDLKKTEPIRKKYFKKLGLDYHQTATTIQSHSNKVTLVKKPGRYKGDGLVTSSRGLVLAVTVADCFPVYFYNPKNNYFGIVHSGWRGTVSNIALSAVQKIKGDVKDLQVLIGPGIQKCHFEIREDVFPEFKEFQNSVSNRNSKTFVDIPRIIKTQLLELGVKRKNIEISKVCTYCNSKKYFSYRRDKPEKVQAMLAYISLTHS